MQAPPVDALEPSEAHWVPASEGLSAGEIEAEDDVLVMRRIPVHLRLKAQQEQRKIA